MKVTPGLRIKFREEKLSYTVRASNERYTVCTKPLAVQRTVLYTVIDWNEGVRGAENLIFGFGAESRKQCADMLERIVSGESEISHRNRVRLYVDAILPARKA